MKTLREWMLGKLRRMAHEGFDEFSDYLQGHHDGCIETLHSVLRELEACEDVEDEKNQAVLEIISDIRLINSIYWGEEEWSVDRYGVTSIIPYLESGTLWFAVYEGDFLERRIPGHEVTVCYKKPKEAKA